MLTILLVITLLYVGKLDIMCMFKALQKDREEVGRHLPIRLEEFYHFYNVLDLRWRQVSEKTLTIIISLKLYDHDVRWLNDS